MKCITAIILIASSTQARAQSSLRESKERELIDIAEQEIKFICLDDVEYASDPSLSPNSPALPKLFHVCNVDDRDFCPGSYALTPPKPNGLLHVFLHGTTAPAGWHSKFLKLSAERGFHTLGLEWPSLKWDTNSSANYCDADHPGDEDCLYNMHRQLLLGGMTDGVPDYWDVLCPAEAADESFKSCTVEGKCCTGDYIADVPESGSIIGLVARAIDEGEPEWTERFLDEHGNIRWNKVIFSGHSQGANMAAFAAIYLTAKHGSVAGLSLISGPKGLSKPPKSGRLVANRWVYYPKEYFISPRGKAVSWSDLNVRAMASEFEPSYNRADDGEMTDMWDAMGLGHPYDLTFQEKHGDLLTTKKIPKQARAVASPLDFAPFTLDFAPFTSFPPNDGYHPSTAIDCLTPRSDPYPGDGSSDTPAVYAENGPDKGVWSWVLGASKSKMSNQLRHPNAP